MNTVFASSVLGSIALKRPAALATTPSRPRMGVTRRQVGVYAFFSNAGGQQQQPPKQGGAYPDIYQSPKLRTNELTDEQRDMLKVGTALRNIGWLSFWSQLILTTVSGIIILFSTGMTSQGNLSLNPMDVCTFIGVVCGLIATFFSWSWIRAGRKMGFLENVSLQNCNKTVLASTTLNLVGMGATIIGLQSAVGGLVAKTLTTAAGGYYGPRSNPPPVAFDVFSVQACSNTILAHFVGLVLGNWLLRTLNRYLLREEERGMSPSAPPMPSGY